jgi:hypothetical protein
MNQFFKMFKNWNRTGKIKALILGVLFLPNIVWPINSSTDSSITSSLFPLIFGVIAIPLVVKINSFIFGLKIEKPTWNHNPLHLLKPLLFFHFMAVFFISTGISIIIGTLWKYQAFNQFGLSGIFFGIGILLGIELTLKITRKV